MSQADQNALDSKAGEMIFIEGPPAGHCYLRQVYHVNNIVGHRWNEAIQQYEFEVTW